MKIDAPTNLTRFTEAKDLALWVSRALDRIVDGINGRLELTGNVKPNVITVTFTAANAFTSAAHNLGRVPTGYIPVAFSVNMTVYDDPVSKHDANFFYLRSSAVGTAKFWVF